MSSLVIDKLRNQWARIASLGANENDLDQLVTLAQDLELARVCTVIRAVLEIGAKRLPPEVLGVLRLVMEELESKAHRPVVERHD